MTNLREHVEQSIRKHGLFRDGERIVVAVSGGLDSTVLLHLLHQLSAAHGWKLAVAHFNHQLRGRSSDADERFVRRLAGKLGLPVFVARGDVRNFAKRNGLSMEMAARQRRHEFLARAAARFRAHVVALAHHADDQAELFFLRLLRGAGGEGLGGMKWRAPSPINTRSSAFRRSGRPPVNRPKTGLQTERVRPLLDVPREALRRLAVERQVAYREDASNASLDIVRNRIRHRLLPLLRREYQPAVGQTVARLMDIVGADATFVRGAAAMWLRRHGRAGGNPSQSQGNLENQMPESQFHNLVAADVSRRKLRRMARTHVRGYTVLEQPPECLSSQFEELPVAAQRAVLRLQLMRQNVVADFDLVERLRAEADRPVTQAPGRVVLRDAAGLIHVRAARTAHFKARRAMVELKGRAGERTFGKLRLAWRITQAQGSRRPRTEPGREFFDADAVGSPLQLRHWQPGDRFQPIGLAHAVKLQDLLTNARVPAARRRELVVATTADGRIFWVEGLRMGALAKLRRRTISRLQWRWNRL